MNYRVSYVCFQEQENRNEKVMPNGSANSEDKDDTLEDISRNSVHSGEGKGHGLQQPSDHEDEHGPPASVVSEDETDTARERRDQLQVYDCGDGSCASGSSEAKADNMLTET